MNTLLFAAISAATNVVAELPPVVVYASRVDQTAMNLPQNVQVITAADIARSGAHDVADLISKVAPSVSVNRLGGNNPALTQISMGGYGENGFGRVLVLVDGERLNNPDMNAPNLAQVSLASVKQIEILSGPQTVLHGDGASAGMINIVTEPSDYERHGAAEVHVGNWGTVGGSLAYRGGIEEEGIRYWASGAYDHSDGYRDNSGFDIWNANGGIRKDWANGSWLKVSAFGNHCDYQVPSSLSRQQWKDDPKLSLYNDDYYRRTTYGLNATLNAQVNDENAIRVKGTASRREMRTFEYGYWNRDYQMASYEVSPQWVNKSDLFSLENEFILGMDFRHDRNDARSWGKSTWGYSSRRGRITRQNLGVFAQDTLHFTDSLALQLGGRYSRFWGRDTGYNSEMGRNKNEYAYDIALLFTPIEDLKAYVRFSRFFRMPDLDELAYSGGTLDSERGYMLDVGADWKFLDEFYLGGNLYCSKLENEIFYNPYVGWGVNMNSPDDTIREGLNLRLGWEREKVAGVRLTYSLVHAEFDGGQYDGKEVPLVPKQTVSLTGRVWLWDECCVFGGYRYQTAQWAISDFNNSGAYAPSRREGRIPDFGLFHIGVEYAPAFASWIEGVKIGFTIDNLFDKNYCDYATYGVNYWPGAGRSYTLTMRYEF